MVSRARQNRVKAQNGKPSTNNAEEIDISDEFEFERDTPAGGPGATIDNAQDIHVIAKALGGSVGGIQPRVEAVQANAAANSTGGGQPGGQPGG